jgi:hypothetical protein
MKTAAEDSCIEGQQLAEAKSPPRPPLPDDLLRELRRHFTTRRIRYISAVLSAAELRIIGDLRDAVIIAQIKRMSPLRLKRFDRFVPVNAAQQRAFQLEQVEWLKGEHYLLCTQLGRTPTHAELFADFNAHRNGQRFRAFYVMKYPQRMKDCSLSIDPCPPPTVAPKSA